MVSARMFRRGVLITSACVGGLSLVSAGMFAVGGAGIYGSPLAGNTYYNVALLLVLLCGPAAILPCTIVETWKPNWGAMGLCSLAIVEICVVTLNNIRDWGFARGDAALGSTCLAGPMFVIGSLFLFSNPTRNERLVLCWRVQLVIVAIFAIRLGRPFSQAAALLLWFFIILRFVIVKAKSSMNDGKDSCELICESPSKESEPQKLTERSGCQFSIAGLLSWRHTKSRIGAHIVSYACTSMAMVTVLYAIEFLQRQFDPDYRDMYGIFHVVAWTLSLIAPLPAAAVAILFCVYYRLRKTKPNLWCPIIAILAGYWGFVIGGTLLLVPLHSSSGLPSPVAAAIEHTLAFDRQFQKLLIISICTTAVFGVYWTSLYFCTSSHQTGESSEIRSSHRESK